MNGVINIYKEKGFTSFDVIAKLRGILKMRKIGHTGTLDPDAEGVLPVCIGTATGLCSMLMEKEKVYETVLLLGTTTDTQDLTGKKLHICEMIPKQEKVLSVLEQFIGTYEQIPPMYSAIKVGGKKLYELAREGKEIERTPRKVNIQNIEIIQISEKEVSMRVVCSKGTYIRTLCHDIGQKLGCGGCMKQLVRIKSGTFSIEQSYKLKEVEDFYRQGKIEEILIPVDQILSYPSYIVLEVAKKKLLNGNPLIKEEIRAVGKEDEKFGRIRMYLSDREFAGIYEWNPEKERYYPVKMFLEQK